MRVTRRTITVLCSLLVLTALAWQGTKSVSADTTVNVCGIVSNYTAAGVATPGSITIGGVTYPILPGVSLSGAGLLSNGANVCVGLTLNAALQVTGGSVSANATTSVNVCGVVTAYQAATANAPGSITIGGTTIPIAAGTTITGANQLTANANACLNGTLNALGQVVAPSTITLAATSTLNVCGVVSAYTAATANAPGSITIGGTTIPIAAGANIGGAGLIVVGNNICLNGTLNATGQIIAPTSASVGATTSFTVCGAVSSYTAATANAPGSITIGGTTIPIAAGTTITNNNLITVGANLCLTATLNASGQAIPPTSVSAGATVGLTVCGTVDAYVAATANAAGAITISGVTFPIAAGTTITNNNLITLGSNLCLSLTLNASGQVIPPSFVIVDVSASVTVCGTVTAFTAATANTPGSITVGGVTFPIAAGATINGQGNIAVGTSLQLTANLNAAGQITSQSAVTLQSCQGGGVCGTVTAYVAPTATASGSITVGGVTIVLLPGTALGNVVIGSQLCVNVPVVCGTVTAFVAPTATTAGSITINGVTITLAAGTTLGFQVTVGQNTCVNTSTTPLPTPTPTPTPTPPPGPGNAACPVNICFLGPNAFCTGVPLTVRTVRIPQVNFGNPVYVHIGGSTSDVVKRYLGCDQFLYESNMTASRVLTKYYLAAQISLSDADARSSVTNLAMMTSLGCFVMPMGGAASPLPVTLSNGVTITVNTTFRDLFAQTEAAIRDMRTADMQALTRIYQSLGCRD